MNIRKAGTGSNVNPFYGLISWFVLILKGCFGKSFPFLFYLPLCFILLSCIPSLWAFLCLQVFTMSFDCSYIIGHMTLVATYVNSPWPATAHTLLFFLYILIQVTTQGIVLWGCLGQYFSIQADPIQILLPTSNVPGFARAKSGRRRPLLRTSFS